MFLLDIRKLDQLKKNNKERKIEKGRFLEYDIGQFNAKLPANSEYIIDESHRIIENDGQKRLEFLELIQKNNELLRHESNQLILAEKWREKAAFKYYVGLLLTLAFVIFYSIYIEMHGRTDVRTEKEEFFKIFSLIFVAINLFLKLKQLVSSFRSRQKFCAYMCSLKNLIEWTNFILCPFALLLPYGNWKSSFCSLSICLSYVVLMTRMDKMPLGGYVKVIGKIFIDSLKPLVGVVFLMLGFIMAYHNRAQ